MTKELPISKGILALKETIIGPFGCFQSLLDGVLMPTSGPPANWLRIDYLYHTRYKLVYPYMTVKKTLPNYN